MRSIGCTVVFTTASLHLELDGGAIQRLVHTYRIGSGKVNEGPMGDTILILWPGQRSCTGGLETKFADAGVGSAVYSEDARRFRNTGMHSSPVIHI